MLIMAAYFVADGIIVARGVGSDALAAVNICMPLMLGINSVILSLAVGTSIIISILLARKKYMQANNTFSVLLTLTTAIALILTVIGLYFIENISYLIGSTTEIHGLVQTYLSVILYFIVFFCLQITLSNVVRNDGNPNLALLSTMGGSLLNIPLDVFMVFVLKWGIFGAAIATGLSQAVGAAVLSIHFIRRMGFLQFVSPRFNFHLLKRMFHNGIPVFFETVSIAIFIITMNILAAKYYGTAGVAAFAIVGAVSMLVTMFFVGIGQTNQPLISYNFGHAKYSRIHDFVSYSLKVTITIGLIMTGLAIGFAPQIVNVYIDTSVNPQLALLGVEALRIYAIGYVFTAINIALVKYFQSIEDRKLSLLLTSSRALSILIPVALIVPNLFGGGGIWFIIPIVEFCVTVISSYFYRKSKSGAAFGNTV
jgi:putative MATE family efflux protein